MSRQITVVDESYDDAKRKFLSLAKILLVKSHKVAMEETSPELRIHIEALVAELDAFVADLDKEFDKAWKENSKQISASHEELVILATQVQEQGQALVSIMDETWPIRDDLTAFMSELIAVSNLILVQLDKRAH